MESKTNFKELMKERHSARYFQSKEIPKDVLKEIISTSLLSPSWGNSQPWNIYVASGETLSEIRKIWISKSNEKVKGYPDMDPAHRTSFSERSQKHMEVITKYAQECSKDPNCKSFMGVQSEIFNAPTVVYLTLPKGYTKYSVLDLGGLEMSIMLAAKDLGVDSIPAYLAIIYPDVIRKYCKIPDNEDIIIGIALGYEDDNNINKYRAKKMTVDECCHFYD